MAGIARVGDIVGKGGILVGPFSPDVTVNGRPVALEACVFTPHPPCNPYLPQHCFGIVLSIPSGVTVNGVPPLTKGSIATCADPILTASSDVIIMESGLAAIASIAASAASGDASGMSAYEKIGYQAAGSILSGEDPNKVLTSAAIASAGVAGGGAISEKLVAEGVSKAAAAATAQVAVAGGRAVVTGENVGAALVTSAVTAGVGAGVNAAQGEIKKVIK